ncbi:hypothetical protein [Conexibacter sp. DBS9H8]|uniref:hypothetical protein n=1 Tax=Conexibacter sp. DBS9H8 TaxID=2937801 RepID=UPI00200FBEC2|nr:hypothetical protein [Conexibacter sp. DBS9H8]
MASRSHAPGSVAGPDRPGVREPVGAGRSSSHPGRSSSRRGPRGGTLILGVVGLAAASVLWIELTHAHPAFDAYGWMVWGRQTLAGNLNTGAAPSWKPLPYLFDLPFALFGSAQLWLWTFTATFLGLGGSIFAFRVAATLAGPGPAWVRGLAGLLGAGAFLSLYGMWRQLLITDTDPIVVGLCLAAVDAHLHGRRHWALIALFFAGLGRPEVWLPLGLYGLWLMREPTERRLVLSLGGLTLLAWFLIPGLTSPSWFQAGNAALGFATAIRHGSRIAVVLIRLRSLYDPLVWGAVALACGRALWRRDRVWLVLIGAAVLWVATEVAFAYHGWPAAPRYLLEPAALLGVLAAAAVARAIRRSAVDLRLPALAGARDRSVDRSGRAHDRRRARRPASDRITVASRPWRVAAAVVILATTAGVFGAARVGALLHDARHELLVTRQLDALETAVSRAGGPTHIRACAAPLGRVGNESELAWLLGMNVGNVGHKPGVFFRKRLAAVYIRPDTPLGDHWRITAINLSSRRRGRCREIPVSTSDRRRHHDHRPQVSAGLTVGVAPTPSAVGTVTRADRVGRRRPPGRPVRVARQRHRTRHHHGTRHRTRHHHGTRHRTRHHHGTRHH